MVLLLVAVLCLFLHPAVVGGDVPTILRGSIYRGVRSSPHEASSSLQLKLWQQSQLS